MKIINLILIFLFSCQFILAQDELKCEEDLSSFLGSKKDKITSARIVDDNDNSLSIEVDIEGFSEGDFTLKGQLLNRKNSTTSLREISSEKIDIPKGGGTVEITFRLDKNEANSSLGDLEAKYVKFVVSKSGGGLLDGFEGLEGLNFSGTELICACNKKWRSSSSTNSEITIEVDLTPFKSANTINQGS